jgi:hypothetical protein
MDFLGSTQFNATRRCEIVFSPNDFEVYTEPCFLFVILADGQIPGRGKVAIVGRVIAVFSG